MHVTVAPVCMAIWEKHARVSFSKTMKFALYFEKNAILANQN
jgi:hypothetical protein